MFVKGSSACYIGGQRTWKWASEHRRQTLARPTSAHPSPGNSSCRQGSRWGWGWGYNYKKKNVNNTREALSRPIPFERNRAALDDKQQNPRHDNSHPIQQIGPVHPLPDGKRWPRRGKGTQSISLDGHFLWNPSALARETEQRFG